MDTSQNTKFPLLMSPLQVGPVELRNRSVFTGHDTLLQSEDGLISDAYIAYQVARAKGGAGLLCLSAAAIDEFSCSSPQQLRLDSDAIVPGLRKLADAVHPHGAKVFAQLLQSGREVFSTADGSLPVAYSASATPSERFRVLPRELSVEEIQVIIRKYAEAAVRALDAGLDGVEIVGNQGNLPAQFLAATVNKRTDDYGGSLENRMRFTIEVARAVREAIGTRGAFGLRLSADEIDNGVESGESMALCRALDAEDLVDYFSLVVGNQATRGGSSHVVAPMDSEAGYVGSYTQGIKQAVKVPVMATGRYNTPQAAEAALGAGQADACGMTRAMICDPDIIRKTGEGRHDDIRACIACVQACIGHYQKHAPVSCIQFPESGRELKYSSYPAASKAKKVLVVGGGPAGMKAAAIAATRGHDVTLYEAGQQLGGQAQIAQKLPTRAEFGGIITNLQHEMKLAGVTVRLNSPVDRALIEAEKPDTVILATGGFPVLPDSETTEGANIVTADDVIEGRAKVGKRVVIADTRTDWVGIGVAEMLAAAGSNVTLVVQGVQVGEFIPMYVRDRAAGRLFKAGVEVMTYGRFFGADSSSAYFQHATAMDPIVFDDVDTVVLSAGYSANRTLEAELQGWDGEVHIVGDCMTPRTAEEAVLDGLKAGCAV